MASTIALNPPCKQAMKREKETLKKEQKEQTYCRSDVSEAVLVE